MPASQLLFLGVFLAVMGGIHAFLVRRLVQGLAIRSRAVVWTLRGLAVLLALSYPLTRWLDTFAPDGVLHVAHAVAGTWFALMFQLFWMSLVVWLLGLLLRRVGIRLANGRLAVLGVVLAALVLCTLGWIGARRDAVVRRVQVPVAGLAPELTRLEIAVVADLHAGALMDEGMVRRRVREVVALEPDLILVPGDVLDQPPERLGWLPGALAGLRAPLGVFATTGNHEYYVGVEQAVALLERAGLDVLMNERVELANGLVVAGIEDRTADRFDRPRPAPTDVLAGIAKDRPVLYLNHTPATAEVEATVDAGADLVVSGHTHGGQIWPFGLLTRLVFPYHHGLYAVGAGYQLTTCGIGWWGPSMRLGTVPEIVLVTLVPAVAATRP